MMATSSSTQQSGGKHKQNASTQAQAQDINPSTGGHQAMHRHRASTYQQKHNAAVHAGAHASSSTRAWAWNTNTREHVAAQTQAQTIRPGTGTGTCHHAKHKGPGIKTRTWEHVSAKVQVQAIRPSRGTSTVTSNWPKHTELVQLRHQYNQIA